MKRKVTYEEAVQSVRTLIEYIGDDPERDGLKETPDRVIRSFQHLYQGYHINPASILEKRFTTNSMEMVVLSNIEMYSMCEHHMLPFLGKCHIGYLPRGFVVGISKLARIMEVFSRRLQIQEELCYQIANTLNDEIKPYGVGVVIEAQHMCMTCRGVEKQNSIMTSSALLGEFRKMDTRMEFLKLIGK